MASVKQQSRRTQRAITKVVQQDIPIKIERALTLLCIAIGNKALEYTPLDTSALQNSQDRSVTRTSLGYRGAIVYTQNYAAALHEREDWSPKPPGTDGKPNGGWNPRAQPGWMDRADEETRGVQQRIIKRELHL